jgi:hypothetical protein
MITLLSKLWKWAVNRSPKNAAIPDVRPHPAGDTENTPQTPGVQPIETNMESQSFIGLLARLGKQENLFRSPDGELVRASDQTWILLGCGHVAGQVQAIDEKHRHIRGIAGICARCLRENQRLLEKRQISPFDAERLSLVCTDCAKITVSGQLCCPRHYTAMTAPDGSVAYLDTEQAEEIERQDTIRRALGIANLLFGEDEPQVPDKQEKEPKDAPNPIHIHLGHIVHYDRPPGRSDDQESGNN